MTLTTLKSPLLFDFAEESRRLGVSRPSAEALVAPMRIGDMCRLRLGVCKEVIWVSVAHIKGTILTGRVITATLFAPQHHVYHGDVIQFPADSILEIQTL